MRAELSQPALQVAPTLLGAHLASCMGGEQVTVRVTEVEAYEGAKDPASHAYRGKNERNAVMFGPPGAIYVYWHMGLHFCMNITCGVEGVASAVLIRAGEVVSGHDVAWRRRNEAGVCRRNRDLARGPARLTVSLGVKAEHNGLILNSGQGLALTLENQPPAFTTGPRIGVRGEGGDPQRFPWRFWVSGDEFVSG
ncbi:MAG TPA: DNA-3-methyladenine glycosylase [Beutenbergiaceae bacterium]|nr:DNA-3-methyladenine glycosylase [Beutenbergiaceae bacterium]